MIYALLLFGSVVILDLVLSGDNAVVIGMAANRLPKPQRDAALLFGVLGAAVLRILLAMVAISLLSQHWVAFLGGVALCWVAYKLARDTISPPFSSAAEFRPVIDLLSAMLLIVIADLSMSLDNILAVAALCRNHPFIMMLGFILSILLVAVAARWIADLLDRYKWLNWIGIGLIMWVAFDLIVGNYDSVLALIRT